MLTLLLRRPSSWLAIAGIGVLALLVKATTTKPPIPAPLVKPAAMPFQHGIGASGIVEARRENTNLGVPFSSLVMEVRADVWQKVETGEVLLHLDDREVRSQIISQQAEVGVREAELKRAERRFARLASIGAGEALSHHEFESGEDDLRVAKAALAKARAGLEEIEAKLERYLVRAPISGTVLQVNIRAGEHATPGSGSAPLILGSIEELQIRADIDEQLAPRVKAGARALAYRKGETTDPIALTFVRIEPYIVPKKNLTGGSSERVDTRVLPVIFSFLNQDDHKTYVGQQVDVFIEG